MKKLIIALAMTIATAATADYVWIEAENHTATDAKEAKTIRPAAKDALSGADALFVKDGTYAEYSLDVPKDGQWFVYVRKETRFTTFRWRIDDGPWHYIIKFKFRGARLPSEYLTTDADWNEAEHRITENVFLDSVHIDGAPAVGWMALDKIKLTKGPHRLRIETKEPALPFIDAFLLHEGHFTPRGKRKPDDPLPREDGWWAFCPESDVDSGMKVNLRDLLNEPYAGSKGHIGTKGESFVHLKTGEPVRFWATHLQPAPISTAACEELADFLARRGVNMVRIYPFHWKNAGAATLEPDPVLIRRFQRVVSIFKKRGIYVMVGIYSGRCVYDIEQAPGFESYKPGAEPWLLHLFHPEFKRAYDTWLKSLLDSENPFGPRLAEEPAILGIELQNEANTLWFAFQAKKYPKPIWEMVEKRYADWLTAKHGSMDKAWEAWGEKPKVGENLMLHQWQLTQQTKRAADQVRFCAQLEHDFYAGTKNYLKEQLGYKGLVLASNWDTTQNDILYPALTWAESPQDFSDHHHYFNSPGTDKALKSKKSQTFRNRSGLRWDGLKPGQDVICCGFIDVIRNGKPIMCSEYSWVGRNQWRPEYPLFVAAQSRGAGMDAMVEFQNGPLPGWVGSEVKWVRGMPAVVGQFPGAALLFRTDILNEGKSLVRMRVNKEEALDLRAGQIVTKERGMDFNRAFNGGAVTSDEKNAVENKGVYFSAGKVNLDVGDFPSENTVEPLDPYWDEDKKIIRHSNEQIVWDYGKGIYTVDAPGAQAAVGFLGEKETIALSHMTVKTPMRFITLCLASLDEKPLEQSKRMLLQVMSEQKQYGEKFSEPDESGHIEVLATGGPPFMVKDIEGSVELLWKGAKNCRITPLKPNFTAAGEPVKGATLKLKHDILYYLIEQ